MPTRIHKEYENLLTPKVMLARSEHEYTCYQEIEIDCANGVHLCETKCCTIDFYLAEQELDVGLVRWNYGQPDWCRKGNDGDCAHCEPGTWRYRVNAHRPYVCRAYDCREDKRMWVDFEGMVPNPVTVYYAAICFSR